MSTQKSLSAFETFAITGAKHVTGGAGKCTISKDDPKDPGKVKGNNGFGNGGKIEPAPGNSGLNGSPNAGQKLEDVVR